MLRYRSRNDTVVRALIAALYCLLLNSSHVSAKKRTRTVQSPYVDESELQLDRSPLLESNSHSNNYQIVNEHDNYHYEDGHGHSHEDLSSRLGKYNFVQPKQKPPRTANPPGPSPTPIYRDRRPKLYTIEPDSNINSKPYSRQDPGPSQRPDYYSGQGPSQGPRPSQRPDFYPGQGPSQGPRPSQRPEHNSGQGQSQGPSPSQRPEHYSRQVPTQGPGSSQRPDYYSGQGLSQGPGPSQRPDYYSEQGPSRRPESFTGQGPSQSPSPSQRPDHFFEQGPGPSQRPEQYFEQGPAQSPSPSQRPDHFSGQDPSHGPAPSQNPDYWSTPGPSQRPEYYSTPGPSTSPDYWTTPGPSQRPDYYSTPGPSASPAYWSTSGPSPNPAYYSTPATPADCTTPASVSKKYAFAYAVRPKAGYPGDDFSHKESRDGKVTMGEYKVVLPDGRLQIVRYTAGAATGFQADVSYEGEERHPADHTFHNDNDLDLNPSPPNNNNFGPNPSTRNNNNFGPSRSHQQNNNFGPTPSPPNNNFGPTPSHQQNNNFGPNPSPPNNNNNFGPKPTGSPQWDPPSQIQNRRAAPPAPASSVSPYKSNPVFHNNPLKSHPSLSPSIVYKDSRHDDQAHQHTDYHVDSHHLDNSLQQSPSPTPHIFYKSTPTPLTSYKKPRPTPIYPKSPGPSKQPYFKLSSPGSSPKSIYDKIYLSTSPSPPKAPYSPVPYGHRAGPSPTSTYSKGPAYKVPPSPTPYDTPPEPLGRRRTRLLHLAPVQPTPFSKVLPKSRLVPVELFKAGPANKEFKEGPSTNSHFDHHFNEHEHGQQQSIQDNHDGQYFIQNDHHHTNSHEHPHPEDHHVFEEIHREVNIAPVKSSLATFTSNLGYTGNRTPKPTLYIKSKPVVAVGRPVRPSVGGLVYLESPAGDPRPNSVGVKEIHENIQHDDLPRPRTTTHPYLVGSKDYGNNVGYSPSSEGYNKRKKVFNPSQEIPHDYMPKHDIQGFRHHAREYLIDDKEDKLLAYDTSDGKRLPQYDQQQVGYVNYD